MEAEENEISKSNSLKSKVKLNEEEIKNKIKIAVEKIKVNCEILKGFIHDLEPQNSPAFIKALKSINYQYFSFINYTVSLQDRLNLRISIANELISSGAIDVLLAILQQLFDNVHDLNGSTEIDNVLYDSIKKVMTVFINYSDALKTFGDEICKRDKLLSLYSKLLVNLQEACRNDSLTKNFTDILRITIATLYNTLIHDSEPNLQKIRHLKYLDIIKQFLDCKIERIKISSLLFTAYAADEGESILFKSDQNSITYLLNLLSESMRTKSSRAKSLSTEELAKGIEKLAKNDENKKLLVDLGVLPILKKLMEKDLIKYKEISLSILWSLAFDERNRKIINESFSSLLDYMKLYLSKPEQKKNEDDISGEEHHKCKEEDYLGSEYNNEGDTKQGRRLLMKMSDIDNGCEELDPSMMKSDDVISYDMIAEKSKCSQILNGLAWTLKGPKKSHLKDSLVFKGKTDGHIMISYCWANTELVMKIYDALRKLGYKLWIDKYNMAEKENLMESMAYAVERSEAIIVCISNGYKDSQNCRAEAQYAITKKKPLFPVIVQENYKPDGWLGFCISGLMYCNFKGKLTFEEAMEVLSKQLKRISSDNQSKVDATDHITHVKTEPEKVNPSTTSNVNDWKHSEVKEWFKKIGIERITWNDQNDGRDLLFLKMLSGKSLDTFFRLSETSLGLTEIKDLRIFYENIQNV